jgi:hypothetical protein
MGGVAAFRRSHRSLWIGGLLVLAILLGFALVRLLFGAPASSSSSRQPVPAVATACPAQSPAQTAIAHG